MVEQVGNVCYMDCMRCRRPLTEQTLQVCQDYACPTLNNHLRMMQKIKDRLSPQNEGFVIVPARNRAKDDVEAGLDAIEEATRALKTKPPPKIRTRSAKKVAEARRNPKDYLDARISLWWKIFKKAERAKDTKLYHRASGAFESLQFMRLTLHGSFLNVEEGWDRQITFTYSQDDEKKLRDG